MKTKKSLLMVFMMLMICVFTLTIPAEKTFAATTGTLTNALKAPKAAAGTWCKSSNGYRYKFDASGNYAKKRWLKIDGKYYYFTKSGYVKTGFFNYNNRNYYFTSRGVLVTGWKVINRYKYYFWKSSSQGAKAGSAATGRVKISGNYYYFDSQGRMKVGWISTGGYYYYFDKSTGIMAKNTTIGSYTVDSNGRRISTNTKTGKVDYWVGDSRTVGLDNALGISSKCIAKVGEGYSWFCSTGEAQLIKKLKNNPSATVVFNLGVNDITNYKLYIARYKKLMNKYPKAKFYFLSVNPIDFKKYSSGWVTDSQIKTFNKALKASFPDTYIDSYTQIKPYLTSTNTKYSIFNSDSAGLHYSDTIYKKIYNYVLSKV